MILKLYRSVAARFRSFSDKEEMNGHVSAHIFAAGRKLHKNARAVLNMMAHHSCIITGVSWLNEETIAEATSVCTRTVKRAIDRLIMLGIGRREIVHHDGMILRYFVINRFELSPYCPEIDSDLSPAESETSATASSIEASSEIIETTESVKTDENKDIRHNVSDDLDHSFTPSIVPKDFVEIAAQFFRSAPTIYSLWNRVRIAYNSIGLRSPIELYLDSVLQVFKESVFALKSNRIRGDFGGYFYGALYASLSVHKRRELNLPSWIVLE